MHEEVITDMENNIAAMAGTRCHINADAKPSSEIYYDLNIYGAELVELIADISDRYSVDLSDFDFQSVAPGEGFEPIGWLLGKLGFKPFKSLKIKDIAEIVAERRQD